MSDYDERAAWEANELAGLARQQGGKRVEVEPGVWAWQFPPYYCPHCTPIAGPDTLPLPDCPQPLARHGPIDRDEPFTQESAEAFIQTMKDAGGEGIFEILTEGTAIVVRCSLPTRLGFLQHTYREMSPGRVQRILRAAGIRGQS